MPLFTCRLTKDWRRFRFHLIGPLSGSILGLGLLLIAALLHGYTCIWRSYGVISLTVIWKWWSEMADHSNGLVRL